MSSRTATAPDHTGQAPDAPPLVELLGVTKSYDATSTVLLDVDLSLTGGETVSLLGPSGSGKSTVLSLIAGLVHPDSGHIRIDGVDLADLDDTGRARIRAGTIGIALQADNLIPFLSAVENVEMAIALCRLQQGGRRPRRADARRQAREMLDRLGVDHRADHRPRQLSGGEAQRVALAVALANDPVLLLADEVVAQLDGEAAEDVISEVFAADRAVLYVTHDQQQADRADRRLRIHDHRVISR